MGSATAQEMAVAVLRHPAGTTQMTVEDSLGALRFLFGINPQHNAANFRFAGSLFDGIEQAQVGHEVVTVIIGKIVGPGYVI